MGAETPEEPTVFTYENRQDFAKEFAEKILGNSDNILSVAMRSVDRNTIKVTFVKLLTDEKGKPLIKPNAAELPEGDTMIQTETIERTYKRESV